MNEKRRRTLGHVISAIPATVMVLTAALKILHHPSAVENFVNRFALPEGLLRPLGVLELVCTALFYVPRVSVVGAILLTGYLGGATVTELRASGDAWFALLMGTLVWVGLALRQPHVANALSGRGLAT